MSVLRHFLQSSKSSLQIRFWVVGGTDGVEVALH